MAMTKREKELKDLQDEISALLKKGGAMIVGKIRVTEDGMAPYATVIDAPVEEEAEPEEPKK